jgi:exodeoxyribonuclease VII small subunit
MTTMTFEKALQELETIVRKLEEGHMPLDESVKAYEKGIHLKKFCDDQLAAAQLKIEEVMVANDKVSTKPFEIEKG